MNKKPAKVDLPSVEGTVSTRAEKKQVEERLAIGANVVYETIRREGEEELRRTAAALAWSAFAAGLSMGFSFIAGGRANLPLARSAVAAVDIARRILCGISHRHPRTPATVYRKYSDGSPASPIKKRLVHIAADASLVGHRTGWEPCGNILVRAMPRKNQPLRCAHSTVFDRNWHRAHRGRVLGSCWSAPSLPVG